MVKKPIRKNLQSPINRKWLRVQKGKSASEKLDEQFGLIRFSELLVSSREIEGVTQVAMSKKLGISPQRLCDFEKGRRLPSPKLAEKMSKRLGYHPAVWVQILLQDQLERENVNLKVSVA